MRPADRWGALSRFLMLAAFGALILAPTAVAVGAVAALLAFSAARGGRRLARRRSSSAGRAAAVLGSDASGRRVLLTDDELSAHGLILGASGAGKSTTLLKLMTEQIERGRPVVAIDMKGSPAFARVLADAAQAAGRPFKVWSIDGPAHWNPLAHGNATELKDKLIGTERFTEPPSGTSRPSSR
jgi:DNA helicase HerA-like ATPase